MRKLIAVLALAMIGGPLFAEDAQGLPGYVELDNYYYGPFADDGMASTG